QQQINQRMEPMLPSFLAALHPLAVHASSNDVIDGVRVLSFDIDQQGAHSVAREMERVFAFPSGVGVRQYKIRCIATAHVDADIAAMQFFVASLTLTTETAL